MVDLGLGIADIVMENKDEIHVIELKGGVNISPKNKEKVSAQTRRYMYYLKVLHPKKTIIGHYYMFNGDIPTSKTLNEREIHFTGIKSKLRTLN